MNNLEKLHNMMDEEIPVHRRDNARAFLLGYISIYVPDEEWEKGLKELKVYFDRLGEFNV